MGRARSSEVAVVMSKPDWLHTIAPQDRRADLKLRSDSRAMTLRAVASAAGLVLLSAAAQGGTVQVEGGAIVGAAGVDGFVTHYLGVPFAAAPVAGLRWRPPQPVAPWQGVLETVHAAPACPHPLPPPGSFYQKEFFLTSERQSEDCLYLNLWTPARAPIEKLPVMVWFYGGGFVQGSGSLPSFDGEGLAHRGVIVVATTSSNRPPCAGPFHATTASTVTSAWTTDSGGPLPFPDDAGRQLSCPILPSAPSQR